MTTTTECVEGCTIRGKHLSDCRGVCRGCRRSREHPHTHQCDVAAANAAKASGQLPGAVDLDVFRPECRGCLPRPAEFGGLCAWGWQRLNADVVDAPALARYLWAVGHSGVASAAASEEGTGGRSDPRTRSVIHPAVDALDGLHAVLASWVRVLLDEHPGKLDGPDGPNDLDVRRTRSTKVLDREVFPHLPGEPSVWIRPSEVAGVHDPQATSRLVKWLLPHLAWCSEQPWIAEMRAEVAAVVRTTAARFPVAERTRAIEGVTCPRCDHQTLVFDPPTPERHSTQVNCSTRGCGVIYSHEDFNRLTRIVEWEHKNGEKS